MDIPVLIVGAGPAGLCASIALSRLGVRSLVVERRAGTSTHPKATGISVRTMELFRQWGLDARVRDVALDAGIVNSVRDRLAHPELMQTSLGYPDPEEAFRFSPVAPAVCAQDLLEPILLDAARSYEHAEVRFGTEFVTFGHEESAVHALVRDRARDRSTVIRARYLIAADGAASRVRTRLGIVMRGEEHLGDFASILFRANLGHLTTESLSALYSLRAADAPGILAPTSRDGRWIFATPWPAGREPLHTLGRARLEELVSRAVGDHRVTIKILDARMLSVGAQVAARFREGNVFLVGDAAHRMTPSGGMGMNTAIHGAHNLAWKIGAVVQGWAGAGLLDSYEAERRPVAERNVARSRGEMKELSGPALDLGAVYRSSAVVADDELPTVEIMEPSAPALAGARAPHVWLEDELGRRSTLDTTGRCMVLIAPPLESTWVLAAVQAARALDVPLEICSFTPPGSRAEVRRAWRATYGLSEDRAVLVRPDGHVAWKAPEVVANPITAIAEVLAQVLDRDLISHEYGTTLLRRSELWYA